MKAIQIVRKVEIFKIIVVLLLLANLYMLTILNHDLFLLGGEVVPNDYSDQLQKIQDSLNSIDGNTNRTGSYFNPLSP